jgi:hypothetical protein
MTRIGNALAGTCLGATLLTGCIIDGSEAPREFADGETMDTLVTAPDFTFETSEAVHLHIEGSRSAGASPVEVRDAEGRRLYKGAVRGSLDLDLAVPVGAEKTLTIVSGRGAESVSQSVSLEDGRGSASL